MPLLLDPAQALISPNINAPHESDLKGRKVCLFEFFLYWKSK